jgi:SAM-dependent methyltransferase
MPALLSDFFRLLSPAEAATGSSSRTFCTIAELGCGTGRNTVKLLRPPYVDHLRAIHALDFSEPMLQLARRRCGASATEGTPEPPRLEPAFHVFDAMGDAAPPADACGADGVLSSLVLEHVPLAAFFGAVATLLGARGPDAHHRQQQQGRRPGYLLLTNMHAEMGRAGGQAGFRDTQAGVKVRGVSYAHTVPDVLAAAAGQGFRVVGGVKERRVREEDVVAVGARGRKWVGCRVWFGCVFEYEG